MSKRLRLTLPQERIELGTYGRTGRAYVRVDDEGDVFVGNDRDGVLVAAVEVVDVPEHPAHRVPSDVLCRAAELLGITEGEWRAAEAKRARKAAKRRRDAELTRLGQERSRRSVASTDARCVRVTP